MHARLVQLAATALLAATGCHDESRRCNVVLISLDSVRADYLGCYGHEPAHAPGVSTSPNLDALAARGLRFVDCSSTTSWTLPSHAAILTGEPDLVHAAELDDHVLPKGLPTLAERLGARGWRTAGFYSGPYLDPRFGFGRGFERYQSCYGEPLEQAAKRFATTRGELTAAQTAQDSRRLEEAQRRWSADFMALDTLSHRDVSSESVSDAAIGEIEAAARDERPFFVFAHYFDAHYDYAPPAPYDERFDPEYAGTMTGHDFIRDPRIAAPDPSRSGGLARVVSQRDLEHLQALYEGEIAWLDDQVGRLLRRIDELGLDDSTLIVVLADHGDEFFEHGAIGHRRTLFEESVRVPLIVKLPAGAGLDAEPGRPVSTAAVARWIAELTGCASADEREQYASSSGVYGRFVGAYSATLSTPQGSDQVQIPGATTVVSETYRRGSIKVLRDVQWSAPLGRVPSDVAEHFASLAQDMRRRERLRWIDLAHSPAERDEDWSSDFSDPAARAALEEFHDRYAELLARRQRAAVRQLEPDEEVKLRGLGYVSSYESGARDDLVLPPPGRELLRKP
jgi:arylsulfatase A-like enzyme